MKKTEERAIGNTHKIRISKRLAFDTSFKTNNLTSLVPKLTLVFIPLTLIVEVKEGRKRNL